MEMETCPKCGAHFYADEAWANRTVASLLPAGWEQLDTQVRCPGCAQVFPAAAFRYFGFLSPRGLKIAVGLLIGGIVLGAVFGTLV